MSERDVNPFHLPLGTLFNERNLKGSKGTHQCINGDL